MVTKLAPVLGELSIEGTDGLRDAVAMADYFDIPALHESCVDWLIESIWSACTACTRLLAGSD